MKKLQRQSARPGAIARIGLLAALFTAAAGATAEVYKWVDEEGVIHYGDQPPPVKKAHSVLNERGLTVGGQDASKTEEQIAEEERLAEEARQQHLAEQRVRHRDKVLLETFTTERDLLLTRDDRLDLLDGNIALSERRIKGWIDKLTGVESQIANFSGEDQVPDRLKIQRDNLQNSISTAEDYMFETMLERRRTAQQFEEDLKRYRELKSDS